MDNTTDNSEDSQVEAGCGNGECSCSGACAAEGAKETPTEPEKRRGFHPLLVLSTIVVVLFVLWFCPWALLRSRRAQNQENAVAVMQEISGKMVVMDAVKSFADSAKVTDPQLRMVIREYVLGAHIIKANGANIPVAWLLPRHYGSSAVDTILRINSTIYTKDIGKNGITTSEDIRKVIADINKPDNSGWKKIESVK